MTDSAITVSIEQGDIRVKSKLASLWMTPAQARALAETLHRMADRLEPIVDQPVIVGVQIVDGATP